MTTKQVAPANIVAELASPTVESLTAKAQLAVPADVLVEGFVASSATFAPRNLAVATAELSATIFNSSAALGTHSSSARSTSQSRR